MGLGDILTVTEKGSPTRLNAKMYHWTDALTLSNMAYTPCMRVIPTTTGYGFVKDVALRRDADNLSWIIDGLAKHTHSQNTDTEGGEFSEVLFANMGRIIDYNNVNPISTQLMTTVSGTGSSVVNDVNQTSTSYLALTAGTTNNAYARILTLGIAPEFGNRSKYQIGMEIQLSTNMIFRAGIGSEAIEIANNSLKKYGFEGCSAAPEGTVILVFSADGVVRSTQASTVPIVVNGGESYIAQHSPSLNVKFIKGYAEQVVTKASNVPSSGSIGNISGDDWGVIKNGIKSTTTSESKWFRIWGHRFVAKESSGRWDNVEWLD